MLKDITLGKYYPGNSFVHSLDPRTKILLTLFFMVAVFFIDNIWLFVPLAVFMYVVMKLTGIPVKYILQSLKPLRFIIIFMLIVNVLMVDTGKPLVEFWIIKITDESVLRAVFVILRLVLLVLGTSLMTLTTTPILLTDGLESLMSPLKKIKFPAHELAMMMTIALRFIPTLLDETDRIMKAQLARGADFESGNLIKRAKAMIPIMIPLFISSFKRADELALAMDSRCYHGDSGRTRMKVMHFTKKDAVAIPVFIAIMCAIIAVGYII